MSFSNTPSDARTEIESLLDLVDRVTVIMDKSKLQDIVKTAYGLTDDEKKASETVRADIKTYTDLVGKNQVQLDAIAAAEVKRQSDVAKDSAALDAKLQAIADKQAIVDAGAADNVAKKNDLDAQQKQILQTLSDIEQAKKDIAVAQSNIDAQSAKLSSDLGALATKQQQVADYEATLKAKAAQFQKLTEGM